MKISLNVKFNHFDRYTKRTHSEISRHVRRTTLVVEEGSKRRSRVDTGQMRAGWQVEFPSDLTGVIFNPVEYAIYNEMGTRHMPAQPMLVPAVEEQRQPFEQGFRSILNDV